MNRCCRESAPGLKTNTHRWKPAWQTKCTPPGGSVEDFQFWQPSGRTVRQAHPIPRLNKKTSLFVEQEVMSSCWTRRRAFLFNRKTCLHVQKTDASSCSTKNMSGRCTRRRVFLFSKKTYLRVEREDMPSALCSRAPLLPSSVALVLQCSHAPCSLAPEHRYAGTVLYRTSAGSPWSFPLAGGYFSPLPP